MAKDEEKIAGQEELAVDARLLSEAVIEFNISRKNVGLYPPGHIRITNAIDGAYEHIQKLFEFRPNITLGITKNALIIDNKSLDSRNPVYRECALSFHNLGLAGITFQSGLQKDELVKLHEIMTRKDPPTGNALVEAATEAGISRLKLSAIDHSSFAFISDKVRDGESGTGGGRDATEDYVFGLLEGTLSRGGDGVAASEILMGLAPKDVAKAINKSDISKSGKGEESYDKVISAYLSHSDQDRLSTAALNKLVGVMENLSEETQQQFLARASNHMTTDISAVDATLRNMPASEIEKLAKFFNEKSGSGLPDSLKNVLDKLGTIGKSGANKDGNFAFDMQAPQGQLLHDIDMGDTLKNLFSDDNFEDYVSTGYKTQLERMLAAPIEIAADTIKDLEQQCHPNLVDRASSEIMVEVINTKTITQPDYLNTITALTSQTTEFVETGRFDDALDVYNSIYAHSFGGRFEHEAKSTIEYYFWSEQFIDAVIMGSTLWGRTNREGITKLVRSMGEKMIASFLDRLAEEQNASSRKYMLKLLADVGDSIMPDVISRLQDERWYVVRNMLFLTRLIGRPEYADTALSFTKHKDNRVALEALGILLRHEHKLSIPHLRAMLNDSNPNNRDVAVRLTGIYKVRPLVPVLSAMVEKKDALGDDELYKPSMIKSLGMIGDPQAIPFIATVINAKSLLQRKQFNVIKKAAFMSLGGYPPDTVRQLAEAGTKFDDDEVKSYCAKLLRRGGGQ